MSELDFHHALEWNFRRVERRPSVGLLPNPLGENSNIEIIDELMQFVYDYPTDYAGGVREAMARKIRAGRMRIDKGTNLTSYVALSRLLTYAAREAAAQNRFTTAELIQDAIASLPDQAAPGDDIECESRLDGWPPPLGRA